MNLPESKSPAEAALQPLCMDQARMAVIGQRLVDVWRARTLEFLKGCRTSDPKPAFDLFYGGVLVKFESQSRSVTVCINEHQICVVETRLKLDENVAVSHGDHAWDQVWKLVREKIANR